MFFFCQKACGSHSFTDMLLFLYGSAVRHIASVIVFSADVGCLYVEVSVLGVAIRGRPSSENSSDPLSNESLSQAEVVFKRFLS